MDAGASCSHAKSSAHGPRKTRGPRAIAPLPNAPENATRVAPNSVPSGPTSALAPNAAPRAAAARNAPRGRDPTHVQRARNARRASMRSRGTVGAVMTRRTPQTGSSAKDR
jgi:hypothetical protein